MKKNLFISFLFISVLILVVGCTNNTKKALEENDPKYCEKIGNIEKKADCFSVLAIATLEEKYCGMINIVDLSGPCYTAVAMEKNDEYICTKLKSERHREACIDGVFLKKTIKDHNMANCKIMHQEISKGLCYITVFKIKEDISLCKMIDGEDQNLCKLFYVKTTKDSSKCNEIGDPMMRATCTNLK
jgi:hypothetical protein